MTSLSHLRSALRLGCIVVACAAPAVGDAQNTSRSVKPVPQPSPPAMVPGAPGPGAPVPGGLPSPIPNPAGLQSRFPAGLPPPGTPPDTTPDPDVPPPTNITGGPGYAPIATPRLPPGTGPGPYTALQIAQSFLNADTNRDGELTRAEALRLAIVPYSLEEIDRNHDGIITRFEYEDALR